MFGCKDNPDVNNPQNQPLALDVDAINAPAAGDTHAVEIKSNYPWTAAVAGTKMFSVSTTSGDGDATMIVTVRPTTEENERTGSITIRSAFGNEVATINIHQDAAPFLKLEYKMIDASFEGGEYYMLVSSNCNWTTESSNTAVAIVTPSSGQGTGFI